MHQHALSSFHSFFYELENCVGCLVLGVKYHLVVLVHPEKSEIGHAYRFPMVGNLLACTINDVGDLICHYELQVLGSKLIANEETIPYLDSPNHLRVEHGVHVWVLILALTRVGLLCLVVLLHHMLLVVHD